MLGTSVPTCELRDVRFVAEGEKELPEIVKFGRRLLPVNAPSESAPMFDAGMDPLTWDE